MSETVKSVITNRDRGCLGCRLVSGCGLIGAGIYVSYHSKKFHRFSGKSIMLTIGGGLMVLGTARVLDLPPFQNQFSHE